ncbi:Lipopolysaccharide-modifying protein [Metarhizium guizhouense ARSEF 977]|uniref:Lipopolysaccharide-modifying protein n=1 Tax=Metarhizium guizhouense (strain ARSEF 977) TaxID=1276136 RepID=A0A0B4GCU3_METGA|nr:Lipopolysaccharide-modifying protein [Metarhizium guizhouense ARSEF 977]
MVLAYLSRPAFSIKRFKSLVAIAATLIIFTFVYKSAYSSFSPRYASRQALLIGQKCPPDIANDDTPTGFLCRIRQAQEKAQARLKNQSSNVGEAVAEYRRRYRRSPPKGFEEWVAFALNHDSRIIDDFDQIDRDLEPYRTPEARQAFLSLKKQTEDCPRTARITIQNGTMSMSAPYMYEGAWRGLIQPFLHALPDRVFFLSTIDEPRILDSSKPPPPVAQFNERSGESIEDLVLDSCAHRAPQSAGTHARYNDVCQSSRPADLHALIASPSTFSYTHTLVPILSFGRMSAFRDILVPCPCYAGHPVVQQEPMAFSEKKPMIYWRGSTTGGKATRFTWKTGHRERFVAFIQSLQNTAKVLQTGQFFGLQVDKLDRQQIALFKDVFDIHFGSYIQCDEESCKDMERVLGPSDVEPEDTSSHYQYLYDIDGNSMSTRFYRLLSRQAVVFKQTWFQEWHDDRLVPWAHYIPVTMTMEELPALVNFLVNDPAGQALSAEIAHAGSTWSRQVVREIDMSIYLYRLMIEMASLFDVDHLEREATGGREFNEKM